MAALPRRPHAVSDSQRNSSAMVVRIQKCVTPAPAAISRNAPLAVHWCTSNTPVGDVGTRANHAATLSNDSRKKYKLA